VQENQTIIGHLIKHGCLEISTKQNNSGAPIEKVSIGKALYKSPLLFNLFGTANGVYFFVDGHICTVNSRMCIVDGWMYSVNGWMYSVNGLDVYIYSVW
jgi:hypothetical protein